MTWMLSTALMDLYANSHCSPEVEEAFSAAPSSGGSASAPSSGNLTPQVFWFNAKTTESSPRFPSGMTCKRLTDGLGEDVLTWFLEDFLARTFRPQEKERASPVRARDYGLKWRALFAKWNRDMCSWKTPPSLTGEGWTSSLGTLPRWGLMRDGELWERVMLVRLTNETECGFLPTPVKYDSHGTWESNNYHGLGWSAKNDPARLNGKGVRRFPTPTAQDSDPTPGHSDFGELNPTWVEWIMGWPIGWTSLEPMDPCEFARWWDLMTANPETGFGLWWATDPSELPNSGVTKTVKPKDTEDNVIREARIAVLGNGQVSAVIPAQLLIVTSMQLPKEYD